uniref:Calx-beta domain-containing protein n=1 Tax=Eptatretus burgeri TaxID=7764 RepID=A0A8C4R605_EPTBU
MKTFGFPSLVHLHMEILRTQTILELPLTYFTQLQLAGSKIFYAHTSSDEEKMDSFEFEVTDGYNPVFRTFRISIADIDNKKPLVTIHNIIVDEGGKKIITPFELTAEDQDTSTDFLRFDIIQAPINGKLFLRGTSSVWSFSQQDLDGNLLVYQHDGSDTDRDSFSFTVTDGTHSDFFVFPDTAFSTRSAQTLHIVVLPVDDEKPQIVVNRGAFSLRPLPGGQLGYIITSKALRAEDQDSPAQHLQFSITTDPSYGYVMNAAFGNGSITSFTQGDIDTRNILYVLHGGSQSTADFFTFVVSDSAENHSPEHIFNLVWPWIFLQQDNYQVNESDGHLEVTLLRRGHLGETSFISIRTLDGTAEAGKDFQGRGQRQVQFNPGQNAATWSLHLLPDSKFEGPESLWLEISDPIMAVLQYPWLAAVEILDPADEPQVFIPQAEFKVQENTGKVSVPVKREGDLSSEFMVVCHTEKGSATGTEPSSVLSYSDYISRPEGPTSMLRFGQGEVEQMCWVMIIDDSLYEGEERFNVTLSAPMGGKISGKFPSASIVILPDPKDEPAFYFGALEYEVEESSGALDVQVWRSGSDLSHPGSITIYSRGAPHLGAKAGEDYVGISHNLVFNPGVTTRTVKVTVLDDVGQPRLEGPERFELRLRMPEGGGLGKPSLAHVIINDSFSDLPRVQFQASQVEVLEEDGKMSAILTRSGDTSHKISVRCYTRQGSAQVGHDFRERPNTDASTISFLPGELEKTCEVLLRDDWEYEEQKEFRLVLGSPRGAALGSRTETIVQIDDEADRPIIGFNMSRASIWEPEKLGEQTSLHVTVLRRGDPTQTSLVRVHTQDGSATAGQDYIPLSEDLEFGPGVRERMVTLHILHDSEREMREALLLVLQPDENMIADTEITKIMVYIEERDGLADVTFPSIPLVVSLLLYDNAKHASEKPNPSAGYPLVCITVCNRKHPQFDQTGWICAREGINDSLSTFRWFVGPPTGTDGVTAPLQEIDSETFFASTKVMTLDSIYFRSGARVQCAARATSVSGYRGLELLSEIVIISQTDGLCHSQTPGAIGAEPFSARLHYTGPEDPDLPNLIQLKVSLPHIDGMLPVISTQPLSNFELTLSPSAARIASHRCSNLLDVNDIPTRFGFLNTRSGAALRGTDARPYWDSVALRGNSTTHFYHNLDLNGCLWVFSSHFDMSELVTECGGKVTTDGQIRDLVQSYVTLRLSSLRLLCVLLGGAWFLAALRLAHRTRAHFCVRHFCVVV